MTISILINIDVDDLQKAAEFYCSALPLQIGRRFGQSALELLGGSSPIYLLAKAEGTAAYAANGKRRSYERHWTPVHLDFVVDAIDPAIERARQAGARLEGAVRTNDWGKLAMLADPFGHGICLIEFVGRGYDEIATQS